MTPFIRTDQYNFIKAQIKNIVYGHSSSNDLDVLNTLKSLALERVLALFSELNEDQIQLFRPIIDVKDKEMAENVLKSIYPFVKPFKIEGQELKKLFPKVKKLKLPSLDEMDLRKISYISWLDHKTNKKYIVFHRDGRLTGIEGKFQPYHKKGICAICNKHEDVGLFVVKEKGDVQGMFTNRGNYICQDSQKCNQNLLNIEKLYDFASWIQGH